MESGADNKLIQADIPEPVEEELSVKIRPLERIKLHPKGPVEPSAYGKGKNFSRPWILQDGRTAPGIGSEMRDEYKVPKKPPPGEGERQIIVKLVFDLKWGRLEGEYTLDSKSAFILPYPLVTQHYMCIRRKMLRDFFWEQMLDEVIEELGSSQPVMEYCTEHDANYIKENFEPRNLEVTADKNMHLKYPLYGTGSSAVTFYSETIQKTGPGEILEKFRRCQYFTKPMEERMDDGWVL